MIEFEMTRQVIDGNLVTLSSWFNPETKLWQASAPAFTHVIHGCPDAALLGNTRVQALKNIITILSGHLRKE